MLSAEYDSAFVTFTNKATLEIQVGTLSRSGDGWVVIFYAPYHREVKVTDSFTVEAILLGNEDPLVNQLLNEHCAAHPDGDLVEAAAPEPSTGCCLTRSLLAMRIL